MELDNITLIQVGTVVSAVVGLATAITGMTETKEDDKFMSKYVYPLIKMFSFVEAKEIRTDATKPTLRLPIVQSVAEVVKAIGK